MVQDFQERTGVQATFGLAGQEPDLTAEEAQVLFRIAEEALTNVEHHASARKVSLRLSSGPDRVELVVEDDGVGFDPAAGESVGYGLAGMKERAAMIGAALEVRSQPRGGTGVWCALAR
jgi:signal transduction histidine kinase